MHVWGHTLRELFALGGVVMWPLLACSIVGAALIVDRTIALWRLRLSLTEFVAQLQPLVRCGQIERAEAICRSSDHPMAQIAGLYLAHRREPESIRATILRREGSLVLERLERRLRALSLVGHLSPLLGLLGTVTGLVGAFHQVELHGGQVQPDHLAAGIWEALLTTVFGLVIAIPATAAYHMFEHRVDTVAQQMQLVIAYLDEWFGCRSGAGLLTKTMEHPEQSSTIGVEET